MDMSLPLLKLMSIESVMLSNHLILCCPDLLLPSILPSTRFFSNESAVCIRWPNYWSFSISPSNENSGFISFKIDWFYFLAVQWTLKSSPTPQFKSIKYSGLISFGIEWFDLLVFQGNLKSLLQHHSSKVSIRPHSTFFMVQLSYLYKPLLLLSHFSCV